MKMRSDGSHKFPHVVVGGARPLNAAEKGRRG
jgi:hypothetical protein